MSAQSGQPTGGESLTPTRQHSAGAGTVTGPLVVAIERTWAAIQDRHPDVPDVVLTLGSGSARAGQLTLGHFHDGKWASSQRDQARLPELFIGGEGLARGPRELLGTLLHEAAHGVAATGAIKDTSRQGRYHNTRYRDIATEVGIEVERDPRIGWSLTTVPDTTAQGYAGEVAALGAALTAHRLADRHGTGRGPASNNGLVATCACEPPRKIRLSRTAYDTGPVLCGVCEAAFTDTDDIATATGQGRARMTSHEHTIDQHSVAAQVDLDAQLRWLTHLHDIGIPAEQPERWQRALTPLRHRAEQAREAESAAWLETRDGVQAIYRNALDDLDQRAHHHPKTTERPTGSRHTHVPASQDRHLTGEVDRHIGRVEQPPQLDQHHVLADHEPTRGQREATPAAETAESGSDQARSGDPVQRARIAVDLFTARRRAIERQRGQARADQLSRWSHDHTSEPGSQRAADRAIDGSDACR
jgi:hypothetical protein